MVSKKKKVFTEIETVFSAIQTFFRPKSGGLQKKKGLHRNWDCFFGNSNVFSAQNQVVLNKKKKVFTEIETDFSAEIVRFRLVGGMHPPPPPPKSATD